ncbi:MAG: PAS domain-containing protein [Hyphomicrobiales bacterium]|nr:PAS domain-containing protein [Hyphomicrobiales bacterium]
MLGEQPGVGKADLNREHILNSLSSVVVVLDQSCSILYLNTAAEHFFKGSEKSLKGRALSQFIPKDSPLFTVVRQAREGAQSIAEYHVTLSSPRIGQHTVNIQASFAPELDGGVVVSMQERSVAAKIDRQLTHRGTVRSLSAMAAIFAHEVKNPLSGIRGAAQLLETSASQEDRKLTQLIRDETDRVCGLVDRMDIFASSAPLERAGVNIHEVLDRVRGVAQNGFGRHLHYSTSFDPSLPLVYGNHDQLVQVFLNLVKNAAEAAPRTGGEVVLATAYWHGVRFAVPGQHARVHLPLMISVQDNGEGIPDDLKPHLFEPFVTSKPKGSGLGLPVVAKIVSDHGGIVEFDSEPRRTVFRVMLPMSENPEDAS